MRMSKVSDGSFRASVGRIRPTAAVLFAALVVLFWAGPTTLYCWEGAYNVSLGEPPKWGSVVVLIVLGLVPWVFAVGYFVTMRRGQSATSTLTFATMVLALVTLPVLLVRLMFAAPFF